MTCDSKINLYDVYVPKSSTIFQILLIFAIFIYLLIKHISKGKIVINGHTIIGLVL